MKIEAFNKNPFFTIEETAGTKRADITYTINQKTILISIYDDGLIEVSEMKDEEPTTRYAIESIGTDNACFVRCTGVKFLIK